MSVHLIVDSALQSPKEIELVSNLRHMTPCKTASHDSYGRHSWKGFGLFLLGILDSNLGPSECTVRSTAKPGSEISGVPASETKATDLSRCFNSFGNFATDDKVGKLYNCRSWNISKWLKNVEVWSLREAVHRKADAGCFVQLAPGFSDKSTQFQTSSNSIL